MDSIGPIRLLLLPSSPCISPSLPVAKRTGRSSGAPEEGVRGRRLKTCEPCGEATSRGKKSYGTVDRSLLGAQTPAGSMDRRAVDVGGARTPARASSSHPKVG